MILPALRIRRPLPRRRGRCDGRCFLSNDVPLQEFQRITRCGPPALRSV